MQRRDAARQTTEESAARHRAGCNRCAARVGGRVDEVLQGRFQTLQQQFRVLQKREAYAKQVLLESQTKWTNFSRDILNIAK